MPKPNEELFAGFYNVNDPIRAAALVDERVSDDFVDHAALAGAPTTKAGFRATVEAINTAFRQHYVVEHIVSEGDGSDGMHVGIWTAQVEHVGPFLGVPATGKRFPVKGLTAYRVRDGKIMEHWEQFDLLAIMQNLGLVPDA